MTITPPSEKVIVDFRETEGDSFVYGFGKILPRCPFLFQVPMKEESRLFSNKKKDSYLTLQCNRFHVEEGYDDLDYGETLPYAFTAAAENFLDKTSIKEFTCSICGYHGPRSDVVSHIITTHPNQIRNFLEPQLEFLDDDDKPFFGLFTKCQFDSLISSPTKPYVLNRGQSGNICAPILNYLSDSEESESENEVNDVDLRVNQKFSDPLYRTEQIRVQYHDTDIPPLTVFAKDHIPQFLKNDDEESDETTRLEKIDKEDFDRKDLILQSTNEYYMPQTVTQPKNPPQVVEENKKPQIEDIDDLMRKMKEEEEAELLEAQKAEEPPKPVFIEFLSTIPSDVIDEIVEDISQKFITEYVDSQLASYVKPIFTNEKKAYNKRTREEKMNRQKLERKMREREMKERRQEAISNVATKIANPLIRQFVRQEIADVFRTEVDKLKDMQNDNRPKKKTGNLLPVVVSGLTSPRHLDIDFLSKFFSNLQFLLDEDKKPLIRFRVRYRRFEALLYLANEGEVSKALAMNPLQIEYTNALLEEDKELPPENCWTAFTNQKILEMSPAKNLDGLHNNGGSLSYEQMSGLCDLLSVNNIE
ncbi:hypothetical protein TVAGG3_0588280 [Trichomonas vaginalis G3]|nr:hypothetical protein TVAGG3_0588280 [Trichomonas vaginalis G3]KAI5523056.1 hypothetical protein TVAGG3_0588280 [Trichomonas vaginalis G3]